MRLGWGAFAPCAAPWAVRVCSVCSSILSLAVYVTAWPVWAVSGRERRLAELERSRAAEFLRLARLARSA